MLAEGSSGGSVLACTDAELALRDEVLDAADGGQLEETRRIYAVLWVGSWVASCQSQSYPLGRHPGDRQRDVRKLGEADWIVVKVGRRLAGFYMARVGEEKDTRLGLNGQWRGKGWLANRGGVTLHGFLVRQALVAMFRGPPHGPPPFFSQS